MAYLSKRTGEEVDALLDKVEKGEVTDGAVTTEKLADEAVTTGKLAVPNPYDLEAGYTSVNIEEQPYFNAVAEIYIAKEYATWGGNRHTIRLKPYIDYLYIQPNEGEYQYGWQSQMAITDTLENGVAYPIVVTAKGLQTEVTVGTTVGYIVFNDVDSLKNQVADNGPGQPLLFDYVTRLSNFPIIAASLKSPKGVVDSALSETSTNPVENRVLTAQINYLNEKVADLLAEMGFPLPFADDEVARICANTWGNAAEGTITKPQALAVTDVNYITFTGNTQIVSFNEFAKYFSNVTKITGGLFNGCANLKSITIPNKVTTLQTNFCLNCEKLESVTLPSALVNLMQNGFLGCASLQSITLPAGVTTLGVNAFSGCASLQSITLPAGVTDIGNYAFNNCKAMQVVKALNPTPPTLGTSAFNNMPGNIYVPDESVDAYKAATNWNAYASKIYPLSDLSE